MGAPFFFTTRARRAIDQMARFDPDVRSIPQPQRIIDNVFTFIRDHENGHLYGNFFEEIIAVLESIDDASASNGKIRFSKTLKGINTIYKNENSLGGWLGAMSELLDLVRAMGRGTARPSRIAIPSGNKHFDVINYREPPTVRKGQKLLLEQDIDRTELVGTTKYYVEVKADSDTAVKKIEAKGTDQIDRIYAVVNNRRVNKLGVGSIQPAERLYVSVAPAISITNHENWLVLFTSGVIQLYYDRGFTLIVGGQLIDHDQLKKLHRELLQHLRINLYPANYFALRRNPGVRAQLETFRFDYSRIFPRPSEVVSQGCSLQDWLQGLAPTPPPPPPQPPPARSANRSTAIS